MTSQALGIYQTKSVVAALGRRPDRWARARTVIGRVLGASGRHAIATATEDLREDIDPTRPAHTAVPELRRALTANRPDVQPRDPAALRLAVQEVGDASQAEPRR